MVICVILLENTVDVSVKESSCIISVGIRNNTESQGVFMVKINLIQFIESLKLFDDCLC